MWPFTRKKKEDKVPEVKAVKPSNVRVYPRHNPSGENIPQVHYIDDEVRNVRLNSYSDGVASSSSGYSSDSGSSSD